MKPKTLTPTFLFWQAHRAVLSRRVGQIRDAERRLAAASSTALAAPQGSPLEVSTALAERARVFRRRTDLLLERLGRQTRLKRVAALLDAGAQRSARRRARGPGDRKSSEREGFEPSVPVFTSTTV